MNERQIRLTIDRIVLDGFDLSPHAAARLCTELHNELTRALSAGTADIAVSNGSLERVMAPPVRTAVANPGHLAHDLASSIAKGVGVSRKPGACRK